MPLRFQPLKLNPSPIKPRDSRPPYFDHHARAARTTGRVIKSDQVDYFDPSQPADEATDPTDDSTDSSLDQKEE